MTEDTEEMDKSTCRVCHHHSGTKGRETKRGNNVNMCQLTHVNYLQVSEHLNYLHYLWKVNVCRLGKAILPFTDR